MASFDKVTVKPVPKAFSVEGIKRRLGVSKEPTYSGWPGDHWLEKHQFDITRLQKVIGEKEFGAGTISHVDTGRGVATIFSYTIGDGPEIHTSAFAKTHEVDYPIGTSAPNSNVVLADHGRAVGVNDSFRCFAPDEETTLFAFVGHDYTEPFNFNGVFLWVNKDVHIIPDKTTVVPIADFNQMELIKTPSL
ncbi:MAG: hypothetical protein WC851_01395 [Candidatus Shapirobacteria bacterium]